jgi:hypothetical protein
LKTPAQLVGARHTRHQAICNAYHTVESELRDIHAMAGSTLLVPSSLVRTALCAKADVATQALDVIGMTIPACDPACLEELTGVRQQAGLRSS